ncbi:MAG: AAA family ATPase, partial [Candidatus Lokiarchaeota archaeon]|nr:AAA family ATPase [Candidatus Lokiarchaeota archaeon]
GEYGSKLGDQVVNQILVEMDGLEDRKSVIVIASTNRLEMIDKAMLRPGRFDRLLYVPPPEKDDRLKIFNVHTNNMPLNDEVKEYLELLANKTSNYTGADIENVCREAGMQAIREALRSGEKDFDSIKKEHFDEALQKIKPSLTDEVIKRYNMQAEEIATMRSRFDRGGESMIS